MGDRVLQAVVVPRTICVPWKPEEGQRGTLGIREEGVGEQARKQGYRPRRWAALGEGKRAG